MARLAYLIPLFPSQTHAFFWRERKRLEALGNTVDLISTQTPPAEVAARHQWAAEARDDTTNLFPLNAVGALEVARGLLGAGPRGWLRTAQSFIRSEAPDLRAKRDLLASIALGARLSTQAKRRGIEHVHVHSCANAANVAMFANRLSGLRYSLTLHNFIDLYGGNQREKWRYTEFAISVAQEIEDQIKERLNGSLPKQLFVAPMGVDEDLFKRESPYVPYTPPGRFLVYSTSRLNPVKGVDDLIRAIKHLVDRGIDAEVRIAGADDCGGFVQEQCNALVRELGIEDRVHLLGSVSEADIVEELRNAHAFSIASHDEGLPIAVVEAMAVELPVVVTRVGGVAALVKPEVNGLLVPDAAPDQLAAQLERIARDPELARTLSSAARKTVLESFTSGVSARVIHDATS